MSRTGTPSSASCCSYAISNTPVRARLRTDALLRRSRLVLAGALLLFALAQIVLGGSCLGSWRGTVRIELLLGNGHAPAVLAHLDHVEALRGILKHPVLAFQLGDNALDRAFDAERLVATDAMERLLLLEHPCIRGGGAKIELRSQRDHLLRARCLAQPTLHACVLGKTQHRSLGIVAERAGRASRHAGETERAPLDIDLDRAEGCARGQCDDIDRGRRGALQLSQREPLHVSLRPERQEACRTRRCVRATYRTQRVGERIGIVRLDGRGPASAKAEAGEDRLG